MDKKEFSADIKRSLREAGLKVGEMNEAERKFYDKILNGLDNFDIVYSDLVKEAVQKYLDTEFDCQVSSLKGVGRMTTLIPRLAGYLLQFMTESEIKEYRKSAELLVMKGFLLWSCLVLEKIDIPTIHNSEELYKRAISKTYTSAVEFLNIPGTAVGLGLLVNNDLKNLVLGTREKIGETDTFDGEVFSQIFLYYVIAGTRFYNDLA